jgi:hypothetical protein
MASLDGIETHDAVAKPALDNLLQPDKRATANEQECPSC